MIAERTERRAVTRETCPMFRRADSISAAYSLTHMQLKFAGDAGLVLWLETAEVGERFGGWERIA